ncbi:MAG: T9SS type A sorting domain-containing protein [Melioribacteraceae bacterium]
MIFLKRISTQLIVFEKGWLQLNTAMNINRTAENKIVRQLLLLLILASAFFTGQSHAQTVAPLAKGNIWIYQAKESSAKRVKYYLSDTITIDGAVYFVCKKTIHDTIFQYFRLRDDGVYVCRLRNKDVPYYKLNFTYADTLKNKEWFGIWRTVLKSETQENLFGKEALVKNIHANWIFTKRDEKWTDEYGLVSTNNPIGNGYNTLIGCVISGKVYGDTSMTVTSVEENNIPSRFSLEQNYPNPFNPETTISYKVQVASQVSLKVYDVLGREIVTLVDEFKQPGVYNSTFDTFSSSLTSGVYFYKLQAGNFSKVNKMMLVK